MGCRLIIIGVLNLAVVCSLATTARALPELTPEGKHLMTPDGEIVTLRGVNLGNWLLLEPWMLGLQQGKSAEVGFADQATLLSILEKRFGAERTHELMELYRENWITPRDFQIIRSFGFNAVRLPFHHSLLESPDQPGTLRPEAFKWIDRGVEMAAAQGLYVILDLHGVPGGQSIDAPTGAIDQNRLWTEPEMQDRTVALWDALARRYADNPAVAGYDVVNEPFGDFVVNISPVMKQLFDRLHDTIRVHDPDTLIYAPGTLQGIGFYGDPADEGWTNVGFTEHTYPGLFGQGAATLQTHARFLAQWVGGKARAIDKLNVPYFVGEFNVVLDQVGGPNLMRRHFDAFSEQGWAATMWSYKIVKPEPGVEDSNWYLATNSEPFDLRDIRTADDKTLEQRFRSLGTMPLAVDDELRVALTSETAPRLPLPSFEATFTATDQSIKGWNADDIGDATPGGLEVQPDGTWVVWGGGRDIFNRRDEFRFVHRAAYADSQIWTRLEKMTETDRYAKAGVMWRESTAPDAAHVLLHALPDGQVVLAQRANTGDTTTEQTLAITGFPVGLSLARDAEGLVARYTRPDGSWGESRLTSREFDGGHLGLAVLAHDETALSRAVFTAPGDTPPNVSHQDRLSTKPNLLKNPSFETAEDPGSAADRAKHWDRWGQWFNRETGWTPTINGTAILAYQHWQIQDGQNSGVWQDVEALTPGQSYEFQVNANLDPGTSGPAALPALVEIRLEAVQANGKTLTLATRSYPARNLAKGNDWSRLSIAAQATNSTMRVFLISYPAEGTTRDGAIKFDQVALRQVEPEGVRASTRPSPSATPGMAK